MNGATALDCEKTISRPNSTNTMTMGTSQYFFSCLRNWKNSPRTRPLLIVHLTSPAAPAERQRERTHGNRRADGNQLNREPARIGRTANEQATGTRAEAEDRHPERKLPENRHTDKRQAGAQHS